MQYKRLDPNRGLSDHLYDLKAQLRANDTAPTGDVGLSGQIVATDPETGVETIIGRLPDGSTGIQQWVNDVTPPGQPTTPSAEPTLNGVTLTWDGLILGGTAQPADYDRTEIEYSENGTLWAKGGTFTKANSYTVPGLTVGTSYSFRLVSYDKNNNASTPSGTVTATPVAIIDNADIDSALQELRNKDTELTTGVSNASKAASDAAGDALEAFNKAKSIPTTFYTATRPPVDAERPFVVGDTWYDTDDNNKVYVWDGQDFILSIDPRIEQNNAALIDLTEEGGILDSMQNDIDQKITTYYGPAPATKEIGDLWLDATDPNNQILKRWDGNTWVVFDNPRVQEAYNAANTAQTTADKKIQTFTGTSAPANSDINDLGVGDLWIDTTAGSGKIYRWSGTATGWQEVVDNGEAAVNTALANLGLDQEFVDSVATLEDRAITTFFGTDTPVDPQEGDLWLTGVAGQPMKRLSSAGAWVDFEDPNVKAAYGIAQGAATEADKKIRTFAQATAPTGMVAGDLGDLWIDTDDGQIHRWQIVTGTTYGWVKVNDNGTAAANKALADLGLNQQWVTDIKNQADRAIDTFFGTAAPTGMQSGDLWLTGVAGEPMKRYNGSAWIEFEDPNIKAAYGRAGDALAEADKKIRTFAQSSAPTGMVAADLGDLWIDTDDGKVYRWQITSGTTYGWVQVVDNGAAAANKALTDLGLNAQWKQDIESQADRAISTFYGTANPTGMQAGDLWLSGVAGIPMKRWDGDSWETFEDPNVAAAYGRAGEALSAADSKIITYAQTSAPTGLTSPSNDGDLWIDTDNGKVSRWSNGIWNLVVDNGEQAAANALADLGLNQTFVDKVENLEDKAITTFYGPDTPVSPKEGDLWLTGNGIEPMKRWTNGAWIKFENPAVEAAYNTAGDAEALADKKVTTYAQNDPPVGTVDLPLSTGDLWIDTNDTNKLYRFVEGTGAGTGWIAVRDTGIGAAQDTANTALKAAAFSGNPSFDDWTSTAPVGYTSFTTNPTKETTTVRIPKNGARWSVTTTSQQAGLQFAAGTVAGHLPNLEYYTVELEFYLVSGTLGGAGVILDWNGTSMLDNRTTLNLATEFPNGVNTGKWYRVTKTLRRPTNISGTWSSMGGYLMANWSTFGGAVKNIIFDWFNIRPATAEEITSYGVPGRLQTIDGAIAEKGKVIIQSATPAAADRLPQNLWIDTTPIGNPPAPGNIPKRWNATTSTWDAVTEKAVVDAAALAAKANEDANTALGNAGNAMAAAGERTRIVHLNTTPPTPPSGWKEGDVWYKHATADIKSDITDWYRWTNNAWVVQAMDDHFGTFIPKLNIGIGTYGFLKGTQLEAKSISVEKIILSSMDNVIADGEFRGSPSQWSMPSGVSIVQGAGRTGGPVLRMGGVNTIITSNNGQSPIPVEGGNAYRSVLYVKPNTNLVTGSVRLSATVRLADGVYQTPTITTITGTPLSANVWTPVTGLWTAPTNAVSVQFSLLFLAPSTSPASVDIDSVTVTRAADAKLVVDGSIDGKTITGALIQSMASTYRGIKLSANQLIAYDSSGTAAGETFRIDGNTGAVTMKGNITSGSTITGATIQTSSGIEKIKLDASSLRAWNSSGEEYFSILNGEVTLTGVTNTTGFTAASYGLRPILTSVGNVVVHNPSSNVVNNLPGMQWKLLDDGAAMTSFPAVVSYSGMDLVLSGGVAPDGSYANVEMWSDYGDVHINASDGISIQAGLGLIHMFGNVQFGGYIDQTNIQANLHVDLAPNYALIAPIFATAAVGSPSLIMRNYDAGGVQRPGIWLSRDGGAGGDEASIFVSSADNLVIGPPTGKETWLPGRTRIGYASGNHVLFQSGFPGFYIRNDGTNGIEKSIDAAFWAPSNSNILYVRAPATSTGSRGPFRIDSGTDLEHYDPPTATFAANVGISTSPKDRIYKLTSAPKYKVNREMIDLSTSWNILNVTPSMWYDRAQIENVLGEDVLDLTDPDHPQIDPALLAGLDLKTIPGVSAKDVEAVGLKQFVTYDENGEVEGVSYDRMWILLIPIIRELLQRMTAIDKKPITPAGPLKPIVNPKMTKKK